MAIDSGQTPESVEGSDGALGYQAKAFISYLASEKIDIFGEAIFSVTSGFSISTADMDPIAAWGGRVGFHYRFQPNINLFSGQLMPPFYCKIILCIKAIHNYQGLKNEGFLSDIDRNARNSFESF